MSTDQSHLLPEPPGEPAQHRLGWRKQHHGTRWQVRAGDLLARVLITAGGISTIIAVTTVFLFLLWVVIPLFESGKVERETRVTSPWASGLPIEVRLDEDQRTCWALFPDGKLQLIDVANAAILDERRVFEGASLTAAAFPAKGTDTEMAFGFSDGTLKMGSIGFEASLVEPESLPDELRSMPPEKATKFRAGMVTRAEQGQFRLQTLTDSWKPAAQPESSLAVRLLDYSVNPSGATMAVLYDDGKLRLDTIRETKDFLTFKSTVKLEGVDLPNATEKKEQPSFLFVSAEGSQIYLFWRDGHVVRFDARDRANPKLAQRLNVLGGRGVQVTTVKPLIGKGTYLVGDSEGRVRAWFYTRNPDAGTTDGSTLSCAHEFPGAGSPVTSLAVSPRSRIMAVGYANGHVRLFNVTSEKLIADLRTTKEEPVRMIALAPKEDGLLAVTDSEVYRGIIDMKYPEVTAGALFGKTWYEGYSDPAHVWQSSSGDDAFEPKFGLMPLIFGTIKASFYSLLFGVPLALLSAIYTSEFLHPRVKTFVKPTIELMASLPSVVLGFLAGLVFAQYVEGAVPAMLSLIITMPCAFILAAHLWQLLPEKLSLRLMPWRFSFICAVLPLGVLGAFILGPLVENLFFAGNLRAWLDGGSGSSIGGWMLLFLPLAGLVTVLLNGAVLNPWFRRLTGSWPRERVAMANLIQFLLTCTGVVMVALVAAFTLDRLGFDPRGSFIGTYVQRNALVVGFVMGFAIIPIIYTISEDAMSAVPEHLRAGSLAAGATRWQTAIRVILPTAMSGLFSAVMVGLGRAVGETMIVLMAAGNTPIMDWNIFNGFRTLSANIAVELPEAVANSTHYRTLFLAALCLFVMTFVLNTIAEIIRQRFRRRAYQL
jgi:phosphate transport system permease protein